MSHSCRTHSVCAYARRFRAKKINFFYSISSDFLWIFLFLSMDENDTGKRDENKNVSKDKVEEIPEKKSTKIYQKEINANLFLVICIIGVSLGILLEIMNVQNRHRKEFSKRKYWVYNTAPNVKDRNGILKHVHNVLESMNYELSDNNSDWKLLWSHSYPFRILYPNLHRLKPHQRVNHFPGIGFITTKVELATTDSKYIPKAFRLPKNKDEFLKYASENKNALFLEKSNTHRGIHMRNVSEIDLSAEKSFVQEYIQNPLLVDGHKFDIGVYVAVTSVNPLRVYWYKGDVLFRYCSVKYHPFDPRNLNKYVIGDNYLPTWEVPSLANPYTALSYSMKESFDLYAQAKGKDTERMWVDVQKAIVEVLLMKEHHIADTLKKYPSSHNFFEMMRFDFIVDENLKVYLLEANMSPNLSSAHFLPNQLLYEQVLYNLLSLVGIARPVDDESSSATMISSQKNIAVFAKECSTVCKDNCNTLEVCALCKPCLSATLKQNLLRAHTEFLHKGDFRRLFPPPMKQEQEPEEDLNKLTQANKLQYLWYQGKCNKDITWCN